MCLFFSLGETISLNVTFRQVDDYPVDLYYLMDLSNTMRNHKIKLSKVGKSLANEMKTITKHFKLGFGSFNDKEVAPFSSPNAEGNYCVRNHLSLTENAEEFEKKVDSARISKNVDAPEAGLDAIMQVGW